MGRPGRSGRERFGQACSGGLLGLLAGASLAAGVSVVPVRPFVDGDGDRVDDTLDQCLYSAPGAVVDVHGCSADNDQDADQVPDNVDDCPYSPPGAKVDARGCALDSDFDGVADGLDRCPDSELGAIVDELGCAGGQRPLAAAAPRPSFVSPPVTVAAPRSTPPASALTGTSSEQAPTASMPAPAKPAPIPAPAASQVTPQSAPAAPARSMQPLPARPLASSPSSAPSTDALTVHYGKGVAALSSGELQKLRDALPRLRQQLKGHALIVVQGYADLDEGPNPDTLARTRANRVRRFLEQNGFEIRELSSVGLPAGKPVPGAAADAMRRVELVIERD